MTKDEYLSLDKDVKKIVSEASCSELLSGHMIPGSLVHYPFRSKAVVLRLAIGSSTTIAQSMFDEIRNCIRKYGFGLWPVNSRFTAKTLSSVQTVIISSNATLLGEMEITDNAHLISYSEIKDDKKLANIFSGQPTINNNADIAFGLENSNWIPICEVKDCAVKAEAIKTIPLDQRVVISTGKSLSESIKGQAPLMICI